MVRTPFRNQLLKWVGNKAKSSSRIVGCFPEFTGRYFEPFLGAGAVLGCLAPETAIASDSLGPLIGIWKALREDPASLVSAYARRRMRADEVGPRAAYSEILSSYNADPNWADLVYISRACYGGIVRFRKDGWMSTPVGAHVPISAEAFSKRVAAWIPRVGGTTFEVMDYEESLSMAGPGDLAYCDPPYPGSQGIVYGAQGFDISRLFSAISSARGRGAHVAMSLGGTRNGGRFRYDVSVPPGLFDSELAICQGRSMLRRFQLGGSSAEGEEVGDKLLMTWGSYPPAHGDQG